MQTRKPLAPSAGPNTNCIPLTGVFPLVKGNPESARKKRAPEVRQLPSVAANSCLQGVPAHLCVSAAYKCAFTLITESLAESMGARNSVHAHLHMHRATSWSLSSASSRSPALLL